MSIITSIAEMYYATSASQPDFALPLNSLSRTLLMMQLTSGGSWKKNITSASVTSSLSVSLAGFFVALSFARTVSAFLLVLMGNGFEWISMNATNRRVCAFYQFIWGLVTHHPNLIANLSTSFIQNKGCPLGRLSNTKPLRSTALGNAICSRFLVVTSTLLSLPSLIARPFAFHRQVYRNPIVNAHVL